MFPVPKKYNANLNFRRGYFGASERHAGCIPTGSGSGNNQLC